MPTEIGDAAAPDNVQYSLKLSLRQEIGIPTIQ
jgi:hypothetical protein